MFRNRRRSVCVHNSTMTVTAPVPAPDAANAAESTTNESPPSLELPDLTVDEWIQHIRQAILADEQETSAAADASTSPVALRFPMARPPPPPPLTRRRIIQQRASRCFKEVIKFLLSPFIVLFCVIGLLLFLLFFCLPLLIGLLVLVIVYYCCTSEPIPPRVLLRALWSEDGVDGSGRPTLTREDVRAGVVRRTCLRTVVGDVTVNVKDHQLHQGQVYLVDDETGRTVVFSSPVDHEDDHDDESDVPELGEAPVERPFAHAFHRMLAEEMSGAEEEQDETSDHPDDEIGAPSRPPDDLEASTPGPAVDLEAASPHDEAVDSSSMHGSVLSCDICLLGFQVDQVVAWSRNTACSHCFHYRCIEDWLIRRPTCPSCRQDYVKLK